MGMELDRTDPGRSALRSEWAGPGDIVFEERTDFSGLVRVYSAPASGGGSWRRLRFNDSTEQSVVLLGPDGVPNRAALAFGYLKTLAAVATCTARALGRDFPPRVLILGVGGGALPSWFANKLGAVVDAVELDDAVLRAATSAMGLPTEVVHEGDGVGACVADAGSRDLGLTPLRAYCCDGAAFVSAAAARGLQYDVAIVDVFNGAGITPSAFTGKEFARALGAVTACAVANLTCPVAMWEDVHEFNAPHVGELVRAWRDGFGPTAGVWSVRVAEGQNVVPAVTRVGVAPPECLEEEARAAASDGFFAFDPVRRVAFRRRDWL